MIKKNISRAAGSLNDQLADTEQNLTDAQAAILAAAEQLAFGALNSGISIHKWEKIVLSPFKGTFK